MGASRRGQVGHLENAKGLDSLQLPCFGLHKKDQNVTREVLRVQNISKCVCGRGCAANPAGETYSAPPDLPAAFEPFLRGGDGRVESGVYHYSKSQHTK